MHFGWHGDRADSEALQLPIFLPELQFQKKKKNI